MVRNYAVDGPIDFDDADLKMLVTGRPRDSCTTEYGSNTIGDIYEATWDGSNWSTPVTSSCPDAIDGLEDHHDPGVIALPNGEFKAYVNLGSSTYTAGRFDVCYYDGSTWGDCQPIELAFDDGSTLGSLDTALQYCLGNVDALRWTLSPVVEGAFFQEKGGYEDDTTACFGTDSYDLTGNGIVFAEHRN